MKEAYSELNKEVNELMETLIGMFDKGAIKNMDPLTFIAMQRCIKIVDAYGSLTEKLIEDLEKKDEKLDEILKLLEK